jgi:hypothetical protein
MKEGLNCVHLLKSVPGAFIETCHDRNQVISLKVEELTVVEEETFPVSITFSEIKD